MTMMLLMLLAPIQHHVYMDRGSENIGQSYCAESKVRGRGREIEKF